MSWRNRTTKANSQMLHMTLVFSVAAAFACLVFMWQQHFLPYHTAFKMQKL